MRFPLAHKPVILLTMLSLLASVLPAPAARGQDAPQPAAQVLQVSAQPQGTLIAYAAEANSLSTFSSASVSGTDAAQQLPLRRYGGYQLPMQLFTLQVATGGEPQIDLQDLSTTPMAAPPQPAAPEAPPALDWEPDPAYTQPESALPEQPVFVARQGSIRGQHFVVVAVSPIYASGGVPHLATSFQASIAGALPVTGDPLQAAQAQALAAATPSSTASITDVLVNAAALVDSFRVIVARPGMQEVLYSDFGLAGEPVELRLRLGNTDVTIEKAGDRMRFYAPQVGDRWNKTTTYWMTLEAGNIMRQRAEAPAAPATGAYEQGVWRDNRLYTPGYPGADGDHWFHADMKASPSLPAGSDITQTPPVTVPLSATLPLRAGATTYQVISSAYVKPPSEKYCNTPYQMHIQGLTADVVDATQVVDWQPVANCKLGDTSTATFSSAAPLTSLLLRLHPNGYYNTGVKLEAVTWRRPVELDFQNITGGAEFVTDAVAGSLLLRNLPGAWRLYDVTDSYAPHIVASGSGGNYTLNQVAEATGKRYLLADLAAPIKPTIQRSAAAQLGGARGVDAIYIGPAAFADELAPLLALRQKQGYNTRFFDVQMIYDVFGFGQASAAAIRNFLRMESDWQNRARQISVVLAGDATIDPFAFGGIANDTVVSAWLDEVDPYQGALGNLGEAACDACIAQLDGPDPLTGDSQGSGRDWFAADIWIGRLPARNEQELAAIVAKLVAYETNAAGGAWSSRKVFLADNYFKTLDAQQNARLDEAGDFASLSDNVVAELPGSFGVQRLYYDPAPDRQLALSQGEPPTPIPAGGGYYQTKPRTLPENWRIKDYNGVNSQVIATLSQGAGLVAYNGHSYLFNYARVEHPDGDKEKDKWLLNAPEVSLLGNKGKEFVMLSMTCYTSQFVAPTANGTLDEWLIRHKDGGAIAVWGPTGLSVVSGHELLQLGFVRQLADSSAGGLRLGELVEAGYTNLLLENGPLDPLMTFVLLGDPLTEARVLVRDLYLPAIRR